MALDSLGSHKLRSFLTLLGIIISTTTLIGVISVIAGMNLYIADNVARQGTNVFVVNRLPLIGEFNPKRFLELLRRNPYLKPEEYEFLAAKMTLSEQVGLMTSTAKDVRYGNEQIDDVRIQGVSANMVFIDSLEVDSGRYISETDNTHRTMVAVIGRDLVDRFFSSTDPLGKTIMVKGRPLEVVGVIKKQGSVFGQSRDNFAIIPVQTYFKLYGYRREGNMSYMVKATGPDTLHSAKEEASMLLRAFRHLRPNEDDTFGIISSDELMALWNRMTGAIAATTVAVTSVFMVVGGIVIMNIMLASVTERTHEIGIRKAIGARRLVILMQFLVESAVLAACGGVLGVFSAWGVTRLVALLTPVPVSIPLISVVLAVTLSAAVGLFFGIYPAREAARLDPIEALRQET